MSTIKVNSIKNTSTDDGGIAIDNSGHVQVDGQQLATAGALSHRNMCINGGMQVAQRGSSSTGNGNGTSAYLAVDRYQTGIATAGTWTISQSTEAPAGFSNSIKYDCTTANSSLSAGSELWLVQKIEAQNLQHLNYGTADAQDCTFSFYFKTNKTGVYTVEIYQADADRTIAFEMDVTQTGWERYEFIVPGDTAGTINNDTGIGFWCFIWMAAGTNKTSGTFTSGSWAAVVTANRLSSSQVNFADSTSNELYITGYQFELGRKATPYEHRSFGDELARCQRYYYAHVDGSAINYATGIYYSATLVATHIHFPVTMRIAPSLEVESGTDYYIAFANNTSDTFNNMNIARSGINGAALDANNTGASGTTGHGAVLGTGDANSFIAFTAEL